MLRDPNEDTAGTDPGLRLNLEPRESSWFDFPNCDAVMKQLREELWRDGLIWDVEEWGNDRDGSPFRITWICPDSWHCWICFETVGGRLQLIQVSFPKIDNEWSLRLASAIVRVLIHYQLVVEA